MREYLEEGARQLEELALQAYGMYWTDPKVFDAVTITALLLGLVGLSYLLYRNLRHKPTTAGTTMGKKQRRLQQQKDVILKGLTNAIEEEVLFNRMSRFEARQWYKRFGFALSIDELTPVKARIRSRRASGEYQKIPNIPGPLPAQIVEPKKRGKGNLTQRMNGKLSATTA